jgi:MFS family permease
VIFFGHGLNIRGHAIGKTQQNLNFSSIDAQPCHARDAWRVSPDVTRFDARRWRQSVLVISGLLASVWALGIDETKSVSGWLAALLLVGLAVVCFALWRLRFPGPPWLLCSAAFVALAADDYLFGAHDDVRRELRRSLESSVGRVGALLGAAAILVAVAVLFARLVVRRLPRTTVYHVTIGFAVAILGAGVVDVLNGRIAVSTGADSEWHRLGIVLEESLELVGISLVFIALLDLLVRARSTQREFKVGNARESPG